MLVIFLGRLFTLFHLESIYNNSPHTGTIPRGGIIIKYLYVKKLENIY